MTNYTNKKKYRKKKAKEEARKKKQATRSRALKAENREKKAIEKIQWQNRARVTPIKKQED